MTERTYTRAEVDEAVRRALHDAEMACADIGRVFTSSASVERALPDGDYRDGWSVGASSAMRACREAIRRQMMSGPE